MAKSCMKMLFGERGASALAVPAALFGLVSVICIFGYAIDIPTMQASTSRVQNALDIGGSHGLRSYWDFFGMGNSAFINADAVIRNEYGSTSHGAFSAGFSNWSKNKHNIWIPKWGRTSGAALNDYFTVFERYRCTSGSPDSCINNFSLSELDQDEDAGDIAERIRTIISDVFDQGSGVNAIDDFKNAILFYSYVRPFHYLTFLPEAETEIVSVTRLKNVMTYIVVDPAMSMGDDNYLRVFGEVPGERNGSTDERMWPYAGFREIVGTDITYPLSSNVDSVTDWEDNIDFTVFMGNALKKDPVTFTPMVCGGGPCATTDPTLDKVFKFYVASIDTMPFFHFKAGVVNLIDRLTSSSAYNSTTIVALTGYHATGSERLIPVYPANVYSESDITNNATAIVNFDFDPGTAASAYPLPVAPSGVSEDHNVYIHIPKPKGFAGYVNSGSPALSTCPGADCPASGKNRWDLLYGRALYAGTNSPPSIVGTSGSTTGFVLPEDLTNLSADTAALSHETVPTRFRNTQFNNWVDDEHVGGPLRDFDIALGYSRNGDMTAGDGETPRNIIGSLAMRTVDPALEKLQGDLHSPAWVPPSGDPGGIGIGMGTGYRYVPGALRAACENLDNAVENYSTTNTLYRIIRPVEDEAVALFAFGIYNDEALTEKGFGIPAAPNVSASAINEFEDALFHCLCGKPERKLFLSFLPLDEKDRNQVVTALADVISVYAIAKMQMCHGEIPSSDPCGGGQELGSIHTFFYDYQDVDRFGLVPGTSTATSSVGPDPGVNSETDVALRKLFAAEAFNREIYDIITKLLISYSYAA